MYWKSRIGDVLVFPDVQWARFQVLGVFRKTGTFVTNKIWIFALLFKSCLTIYSLEQSNTTSFVGDFLFSRWRELYNQFYCAFVNVHELSLQTLEIGKIYLLFWKMKWDRVIVLLQFLIFLLSVGIIPKANSADELTVCEKAILR